VIAVVPVAFYVREHISMTERFLKALEMEVPFVGVYHNGGPLADEGAAMLKTTTAVVHNAEDWPFYRMWNRGIGWAGMSSPVCLVLNNDIEWEPGELRKLWMTLDNAPDDVAAVTVNANKHLGHCFAIRPGLAPTIDERYKTWWGDNELGLLIRQAGNHIWTKELDVRHPRIQSTTDHIPGIREMRLADEILFREKWG
jgi:hypothetical protein